MTTRQTRLALKSGNQFTPHRSPQQGRPLNIQTFGNVDLNKLYNHCTPERHWRTVLVNAESVSHLKSKDISDQQLQRCSYCERFFQRHAARRVRKSKGPFSLLTSKALGTYCYIHSSLGHLWLFKLCRLGKFWQMKSLVHNSFQISQDYYPESYVIRAYMSSVTDVKEMETWRLGKVAVLNAPSTFTAIWSVVKPWLSKETAAKVDILGSDYKDVLLDLVDPENLPSSLGGTCICAEAGGCQLSGAGPWQEGRAGWGPKAQALSAQGLANMDADTVAPQDVGDEIHPSMIDGVLPAAEDAWYQHLRVTVEMDNRYEFLVKFCKVRCGVAYVSAYVFSTPYVTDRRFCNGGHVTFLSRRKC